MLTVNVEIQNRLINFPVGNIKHTELSQGSFCKVYVKLMQLQKTFNF